MPSRRSASSPTPRPSQAHRVGDSKARGPSKLPFPPGPSIGLLLWPESDVVEISQHPMHFTPASPQSSPDGQYRDLAPVCRGSGQTAGEAVIHWQQQTIRTARCTASLRQAAHPKLAKCFRHHQHPREKLSFHHLLLRETHVHLAGRSSHANEGPLSQIAPFSFQLSILTSTSTPKHSRVQSHCDTGQEESQVTDEPP